MDADRFRASPVGSLTPISGTDGRTGEPYEHVAYVPNPLPSELELTQRTWLAIADANYALGQLQQGARLVPDPRLLRRPALRREAQSTSALEGTFAPIEEVVTADILDRDSGSAALHEVWNYIKAADFAFDSISSRPVSVRLLCELHQMLVAGTEADGPQAGLVRTVPVAIGTPGRPITEARFVPPPPGLALEASVGEMVDWLRSPPEGMDPVVAAALTHYQFETLHPFNDGNGRIGRLLIVLQLLMYGRIDHPVLTVSPWFESRRTQYQDALADVSASGNWDPWVAFFAEGIGASARDTTRRLEGLLETRAEYSAQLQAANVRGGVIRDIAEIVIQDPIVTIPYLVSKTGKTYPAVKSAVMKLLEMGILKEFDAPVRTKHFFAPQVWRIAVG